MSIAGISSSQGIKSGVKTKLSSRDSYENNIKKQITALEEKVEALSNDDEMPAEEKKKEKQAAQEQLQNLNQELREYQSARKKLKKNAKQSKKRWCLQTRPHSRTTAKNYRFSKDCAARKPAL